MRKDTFLEQFTAKYYWKSAPAKRRFRYRKEINEDLREVNRLALTMRGVVGRSLEDLEGLQASDYSTYQIFEGGDLAFKLIDLENIRTSRVGLVPRRGIMSPAYIRLIPAHSEADSGYYAWFFFSAYCNNIFNGMGGGVRQNLTPSDLLEFPIPLPDIVTQKRIAAFLDCETARIDALIEKKERLVEVIDEKRSALITAAVTGQINELAPSASDGNRGAVEGGGGVRLEVIDNHRSSFVPIASGWHQRKMRFAVKTYQIQKNANENPTVLTLTKKGLKVKTDLSFGKSTENYVGHQIVERGQFVFTPRDFDATPILCGVADTRGCISNLYIVFDVSPEIDSRFLEYYFWGLKHGFEFFKKLSFGMRHSFNRAQFENIPLLHPDLATQKRIAAFLNRETAKLDRVKENTRASIDRLREYRAALITAAVTGQIDVDDDVRRGNTDRRLETIEEEMQA